MVRQQLIELQPKTETGKQRASYHGTRWILRQKRENPYRGAPAGFHLGVISKDGKKFLWVLEHNDPDFHARLL